MLSVQQIEQFHRDGFVKGQHVLDDRQIETLRNELSRVIRDQEKSSIPQPVLCRNLSQDPAHPVWQIVNIWQASAPFRALISHPAIVAEVAQLTAASELRLWHDQIQYKPAGKGGVNRWHQDAPYWPTLRPNTAQATAWVALDDVDEDNGCMSMVPGSHRWGDCIKFLHTLKQLDDIPSSFEGQEITVRTCPVLRGEVHYHHGLVWHGSRANTSPRSRRAIALHYMTEQTRYDASGDHPMKPFITVNDGEVLRGEHFPLVFTRAAS
jgi:phytanoyl-CoA hydroxylase